jgi:hypothetical protein
MQLSMLHPATRRLAQCAACASISFVIVAGCPAQSLRSGEGVGGVLTGTDSAGAIVEITKRGDSLTTARVSDVILGEGEAQVILSAQGLSFSIAFPAGATITYAADMPDVESSTPAIIEGRWVQHADDIFGEDAGTWVVRLEDTGGR